MRFSITALLLTIALFGANTRAQSTNYLLASYDAAVEMHNQYEMYVENFRKSLNVEASDFGLYFTEELATAIGRASTQQQGAAIQNCAAVAGRNSQEAINRMDDAMMPIQRESIQIHHSVLRQLVEMNIKSQDLELFYYYHNYRMEDLYNHLYNELNQELYVKLYTLFDEYFVILGEMETCIEAALRQ